MNETSRLPGIEEKVAFLSDAASYPVEADRVEVLETHMSWVFLVGPRVYKLKKPVAQKLFDFTTVDGRYRNCVEEVRLNSRLGGDTYIGVGQLSVVAGGELALDSEGVPVDWLVVMRRLPAEAMLEAQIKSAAVEYQRVTAAAGLLARFYVGAASIQLSGQQYLERLRYDINDNYHQLIDYSLPAGRVKAVCDQQIALLETNPTLFADRAAAGRLVEAHGDLRPEHVCLTDPPVVIDCLEFSRDLRIRDPADELSFLAMECERLGEESVGKILFEVYERVTRDEPGASLVAFYKAYRALERAKLAIWHLDDDYQEKRGPWRQKALDYLAIASDYGEGFGS
ncbi:phosphotransferase [Marinobacter zhanjiangensis]|uniref:Gluconokinase n=1 Tax=Marinobacter zhanjiangensis TaxID=578215 RepID=A0ABQ3B3M1_9GAMM|nr:phosphotransferase [Marinobacter zhanjiangensis]GGY76813.1 gluconokinase [Marinobacter zhanjiangensis]